MKQQAIIIAKNSNFVNPNKTITQMANVVIMPKQGQSVESCIVTEFKKKVGDKVAVGDVLFSYETDKASLRRSLKWKAPCSRAFSMTMMKYPC